MRQSTFDFPLSAEPPAAGRTVHRVAVIDPEVPAQGAHSADQPAATPLFRDFVITWRHEKGAEWRESYLPIVDCLVVRHLLPRFGHIAVAEIHRAHVMAFRANLVTTLSARNSAQRLSSRTVNRIVGLLSAILGEAALRYGFLNPAREIRALKVRKHHIQPLSLAEARRVIAHAPTSYQDYLMVRFFTGLRSSEINGLRWRHVDFDKGLIQVRETYASGVIGYTKNDSSQREVQMSAPVFSAMQRQRRLSKGGPNDFVFQTGRGKPIDHRNFDQRVWLPLLRKVGLERRRPYETRHTCATLWLAAGENPAWIASQLGHATAEMLFRVYAKYVPNLTRQDGSAVDHLLTSQFALQKAA